MLTNIYRIAEQAQRILAGGNPTGDKQPSPQELILFASQALASVVARKFFEGKSEGESQINGDFIYSFNDIDVKKDSSSGRYYSTMPATTVSLPYDMGIYTIKLSQDEASVLKPVWSGFESLAGNLPVGGLEGNIGYYKEGTKVYYVNMTEQNKPEKIVMKLVAPFGSIKYEDNISVPDDVVAEVVTMTIQLYQTEKQIPEDTVNDNVK